MNINCFIKVMEISAKRNGPEKLLTIGHLHNLLKALKRMEDKETQSSEEFESKLAAEYSNPNN